MANQILSLLCTARARFYNAIDIIILLLMPVFLCLAVPDWVFTPTGTLDPYVYLGYIRNFSHHIIVFGGTYYGSRLPFIIPGYICYKIFPPLVANYVLHLGFYYVALFSLYFILRIAVNRRAALVTTAFMGFYPYFLAAMGWDYIDGAGIAYLLLTVLLLTLAAKSPQITQTPGQKQRSSAILSKKCGILLFLAGMSLAALIYTNTFLLIMTPSLVLYYVVMRPQSWSLLFKSALIGGSGVILVMVLLGIVIAVAGGNLLFFGHTIHAAGSLLINPNPWLIPGYTWLLHVPFMIFPTFICLTSLIFIIVSLIRVKSGLFTINSLLQVARDNIFSLCHILNFLLMLIMQLLGKPVFQLSYYASYLLPTAFLSAGAQLAASLSRLSKSQYAILSTSTIFLLAGSYLIYCNTPLHSLMSYVDSVWYISAMLVAGALCLLLTSKRMQTINALLGGLAFLFFVSANITLLPTAANVKLFPSSYAPLNYCACEQRQQSFLAVIKSDDIIRTYDITGELRFWYSAAEPLGGLYAAIASTRLWGYRLINDRFPDIAEADYPFHKQKATTIQTPPGTDIVILSDDKDAFLKANAALNLLGLQAKLIGTEQIIQGHISFTMTFIRTEAY